MQFRIADTFTDSLARLTGQEQKAVKTTAFDLQLNPANPGLKFHRIDRSKDPNFWSVRVNKDIRLIVHKTASSMLLCYTDHHDAAYVWAERRKIERHPKTGAAQLVEIRERVEEVTESRAAPDVFEKRKPIAPGPPLFSHISDDDLLSYGVPEEWLDDVRRASEDTLFDLADRLPQEAAEALLDLAVGETPEIQPPVAAPADLFSHPDAQRRFRLLENAEELERALEFPWEKWTVFLHPSQRQFVEWDYGGPARISGTAGTGKTVVALHRAAFLARRHRKAKVVLATFSDTLARMLGVKLDRLVGNEPQIHERIYVDTVSGIAREMYQRKFGEPKIASAEQIRSMLADAAVEIAFDRFSPVFLAAEWENVVDAWQLETWAAYRDVARLGRKTRIGGKQRETLWAIFERVRNELGRQGLVTVSQIFARVGERLSTSTTAAFDFAVVDEAQDVGVAELRFLAAIGRARPNGLFLAGDLGQRIFQQPFSWLALGVDIRGRSHTLRVNYRTSHQIRAQADKLLPWVLADVDGVEEPRRGTVSVFNGPAPGIRVCDDVQEEQDVVSAWLMDCVSDGINPHEIGLFVRSEEQLERARRAVDAAGLAATELVENVETAGGRISIGTMHLAKGLEFRAVAVMACDDEVIPLQSRIETVTDPSDLEDVYNTERHLLYVACTRARDHLLVTGVDPASEFLDDME